MREAKTEKPGKIREFLIIALLLLIIPAVTADSLYNLERGFPETPSDNFKINISNQTPVTNVNLLYTNPQGYSKNISMTYNGVWSADLNIDNKGLYSYRIASSQYSYPNQRMFLSLPSYNQSLKNISRNFTDSNSSEGFCSFRESDYTCEYENFQAWMMKGQALAYYSTKNKTYLNRSLKFATQEYGSSLSRLTCPHSENDFNCENDQDGDNIDISSGMRQGSLIDSLWTVYSLTRNSTVKELAVNYTRGTAESCDVYGKLGNKSFECKNARGQGSMINGYWTAYQNTGNETYKEIAFNLSETNKSSPRIAEGLWKGYQITGNKSLRRNASNLTKYYLSRCPENCTEMETSETFLAALEAYISTGEYGYYRNSIEMVKEYNNYSCNPLGNDTSCSYPNQQGSLTSALWKTYRNQLDRPARFKNPEINGGLELNQSVKVKVGMQGKLENPQLEIPDKNVSCSLDFFNRSCKLSPSIFADQESTDYFFNSSKTKFPEKGSFNAILSFGNRNYKNYSEQMTSSNPNSLCSPWNGDTSCFYEQDQAWMIEGFQEFASISDNESFTEKRDKLAFKNWTSSNCHALENEFNCNNTYYVKGSTIQGNLINNFYSFYRKTENSTAFQIAKNYTEAAPEDCNVWQGDYKCESSRGQSRMIEGFWKAYKVTGNETYLNKTKKLAQESLNMTPKTWLGSALWKTYSVTENSSYRQKAENITENAECDNCSIQNFTATTETLKDSFIHGDYSPTPLEKLLNKGPRNQSCNPVNGDTSCPQPREQGMLSSIYAKSFQTVPRELNTSIQLSAPGKITSGQSFTAKCKIENTVNNTVLYTSKINYSTTNGLSEASSTAQNATDLPYNNSIEQSSKFKATGSGSQKLTCALETSSGIKTEKTVSITIEEEKQGSSSSGGGFIPQFEPYRINYSKREIYRNTTSLENVSKLTEKNETAKKCFKGFRKVYENHSILKLNYLCEDSEILIGERLPQNISAEKFVEGQKIQYYRTNASKNSQITLNYTGSAEKKEWHSPVAMKLDKTLPDPLKMNVSARVNKTLQKGFIEVRLSRKAECEVKNNETQEYFQKNFEASTSLKEGNNTVKISCSSLTEKLNLYIPEEKEETSLKIGKIALITSLPLLLLLVILTLLFRETIIRKVEIKLSKYYTDKLFSAMEKGEAGKAVKRYEKLKKISSGNTANKIINSEYELDTGIYLYLGLETIIEAGKENMEPGNPKEFMKQAINYAEEHPEKEISQKIQEKLQEIAAQKYL